MLLLTFNYRFRQLEITIAEETSFKPGCVLLLELSNGLSLSVCACLSCVLDIFIAVSNQCSNFG